MFFVAGQSQDYKGTKNSLPHYFPFESIKKTAAIIPIREPKIPKKNRQVGIGGPCQKKVSTNKYK